MAEIKRTIEAVGLLWAIYQVVGSTMRICGLFLIVDRKAETLVVMLSLRRDLD